MAQSPRAQSGVDSKTHTYDGFQGLDSSRHITAMETGSNQHMVVLKDAYCDWRGQIVRDGGYLYRGGTQTLPVTHVSFFSSTEAFWVEEDGAGLNFNSERGHSLSGVYIRGAIVTTTNFNKKLVIMSDSAPTYTYDGQNYKRNQSVYLNETMLPAFGVAIQRRLAVAGIRGRESVVEISRVDRDEIFSGDEDAAETSVLRAGYIDVANVLNYTGTITGLGTFEKNRLVVFTEDQGIVYRIDPNIDSWTIDENSNVNIGCIGHNTIANAGTDLLFCSRAGIHSVKRSEDNGILVYSYPLSEKIDALYRELYRSVENKKQISAVFNQDTGQYHVFFPQPGEYYSRRLTMTMNAEGGEPQLKFSVGTFLNSRCGTFHNGVLLFGTRGGVYESLPVEDDRNDAIYPEVEIQFPYFWHSQFDLVKQTETLILQASGLGAVHIILSDTRDRILGETKFEVDETPDDSYFDGVPLSKQYERKWQHAYRAGKYTIKVTGGRGLFRISGLAIKVKRQ